MAMIDVRNRTIDAKIVYYGPALSGKTTNLLNIHTRLPEGTRGGCAEQPNARNGRTHIANHPHSIRRPP